MARGYAGAVLKLLGAGEHLLTVSAVTDVTAHFRRITFDAPTLFDGAPFEPGAYLRLWFRDETHPTREHQRAYTLVNSDPAAGSVSLEFVLHDIAGPASSWAQSAVPGDQMAVTRYGTTKFTITDPAPAGFLLVGDTAGLPAINSVVESLPADRPVVVVLEDSHHDDHEIPLAEHPRLSVIRVTSTGAAATLASAIDDRDWSGWQAWATAETAATKAVRDRLKALGFTKALTYAAAYWARDRAMGIARGDDEAS